MSREMKVERVDGKFEAYNLRFGHDWGTVLLREWRTDPQGGSCRHAGEILFHTSYGTYAYIWSCMANPLKQFLTSAARRGECGYIMSKFAGAELMEVDNEATANAYREVVLGDRREGRLTKEQARDDWEVIKLSEGGSIETLVNAVAETNTFDGNCHEYIRNRMKPAHRHFWNEVFVPFCKHLEQELAPQKAAA
jgi:hypothetical protein